MGVEGDHQKLMIPPWKWNKIDPAHDRHAHCRHGWYLASCLQPDLRLHQTPQN
jgi:hypothetical protein